MVQAEVIQKIDLVDGSFTPAEALHVVKALIGEKISFHKVQRLQDWIHDCECPTERLDGRIGELLEEQRVAKEFITQAKREGARLTIKGTLEISFED